MLYRSERHFALEFADTGSDVQISHPKPFGGCDCAAGKTVCDCAYPLCSSGPCEHGTKLCPSPDACRLPDESHITFWQMVRSIFFGERK